MTFALEDLFRLLLSIFIGGMIGAERELRDKTAGLRTLMFISAGSTLFTIFSVRLSTATDVMADPARVAAQIVSGIGFLGAGAIIRNGGEIQGLTTASTIWLVAALGIGVGAGEYLFSTAAGLLILLVLLVFPAVERLMSRIHQVQTYRIVFAYNPEKLQTLVALFRQSGLHFVTMKYCRENDVMTCHWRARGSEQAHLTVLNALTNDPDITTFEN